MPNGVSTGARSRSAHCAHSRIGRMGISQHLFRADRLRHAVGLVVRGFGSAPPEVDAVAANLVDANLSGHDSHGIGMLPRYAAAYLEGGLKPNVSISTTAH